MIEITIRDYTAEGSLAYYTIEKGFEAGKYWEDEE